MAESASPNLENEIAQIERQLAEKRGVLRRETLHKVIRQKITDTPSSDGASAPTPAPSSPVTNTGQSAVPVALLQKAQSLVNTAFRKSIDEAIKEVKATNNAALIDTFHDLLVDELYNELVKRGKLKAI